MEMFARSVPGTADIVAQKSVEAHSGLKVRLPPSGRSRRPRDVAR